MAWFSLCPIVRHVLVVALRLCLAGAVAVVLAAVGVVTTALAMAGATPVLSQQGPGATRASTVAGPCQIGPWSLSRGFRVSTFASGFPDDPAPTTVLGGPDLGGCAGAETPAFDPRGQAYVGDFYSGTVYVLPRTGGGTAQATQLPGAHFGAYDLSSLSFGWGGVLYASLWGPAQRAAQPELVELDPATGAKVSIIADAADGLADCPGRAVADPVDGDLFVPGNCYRGASLAGAIDRISSPRSANPDVSTFVDLAGPVGGLAFAPDGALYAETGTYSAPERIVQVAGPDTVPLNPPTVIGDIPGGHSNGLAVSATGSGGRASALEATDGEGDVYSFALSHLPAVPRTDLRSRLAPGSGSTAGFGWGATRHRDCLYFPLGPAIERACGGPTGNMSTIASSIPSLYQAFTPLSSDVIDAGIAASVALLVGLPAGIFNTALEENYEEISAWWASRLTRRSRTGGHSGRRRARPVTAPRVGQAAGSKAGQAAGSKAGQAAGSGRRRARPVTAPKAGRAAGPKASRARAWTGPVAVVLVGSLLGALLSPSCGPNSWTLLNFVSIIAAIVAGVVLSGLVMGFYHRHRGHGHVSYRLKALPTGLLVAATCVALSRATGFRPGYLYGAVAAISYSRALTKPEEGHAAAVGALTTLLAGLAAWAAWDSLYQTSSPPGASFGSVLAADFFAAYFVSAVVGTVVSLFPLRFLPGYMLRSWSARAWGVTFGVALFVLLQFLLRPTSGPGGRSDAPLVTTLVLLVLASAGSVVFRDHFARRRRHEAGHGKADPTSPEQAGPEHGGLDPTSPEQAGPEHGGLEQTSPEQAGPEHGGLEQTSPEQVAPQGAIG